MADNVPALPTNGSTDMVTALLMRAATDPSFDADKFKVAVDFLRERETRAGHRAFNEAMARASGQMQEVPKDASNDYLRSRYATLPGMLSVIKPITASHGLAFRFGTLPHPDPDWMTVTCILSLGDHEETTALPGPILSGEGTRGGKTQMNNLQAVGGTVTYLSRYLLGMVFSLIQHMPDIAHDNDGGDPTRGPRQPSPPSHPPYQAPAQQATAGATAGNGNARPDPTVARFARLELLLTGCKTPDDVAEVMGRDGVKQWRDGAAEATKKAIDVMSATAVARLTQATKSPEQQALEDALKRRGAPPPESTPAPADSTPAVPVGSPQLLALLAEIARADQATLDALPTNPVFNSAVLGLTFPEQDKVDEAIKARADELTPSAKG